MGTEHWGRKARPTARAEHGKKVRVLLKVGVHRLAGLCTVQVLVFTLRKTENI